MEALMKFLSSAFCLCVIVGMSSGCTRKRLDTFHLGQVHPTVVRITNSITHKSVRVTDSASIRELLSLITDCGPKPELVKMFARVVIEFESDTQSYWFGVNTEYIKHETGSFRLADPQGLRSHLTTLGVDVRDTVIMSN